MIVFVFVQLVAADMVNSSRPMDRLICGDVGFGKTEVAVRAIFRAVKSGKQVMRTWDGMHRTSHCICFLIGRIACSHSGVGEAARAHVVVPDALSKVI